MRRTVLTSITVMSFTALSIVIGACATAPVDDGFGELTQEQKPTEPQEETPSAKLPPPTQSTNDTPADAGTDAAPKDASTPPKDASPPPTTNEDCDLTNPLYYIKFITSSDPSPCPCGASQCCYMGLGCVDK